MDSSETQTTDQDYAESFLPKDNLNSLFLALQSRGHQIIGPTIDQQAIVYAPIENADELPKGWTDLQEPAVYRIQQRDDDALFGFNVGPRSWKQFLFPPQLTLSHADRNQSGKWNFKEHVDPAPKLAFLGVRACELEAIRIQDRVFLEGEYIDPDYQRRRSNVLVVAVNCTQAAPTCFCTSMNSGPECKTGFDIALTELDSGFLLRAGTTVGKEIIDSLTTRVATDSEQGEGKIARQSAVDQITKKMDTTGIENLLMSNLDHPRWDDIATRCLSCTNCTMVCPTCFCSTVSEVNDLRGEHVERHRQWDSCFNIDFSYMNGGVVRDSTRNRFRQWMTHKLGSWVEQFGTSGCVGCGRCITWCPVGIDLTEEVAAIREETT